MSFILPVQAHTLICSINKKSGGFTAPAFLFLSFFRLFGLALQSSNLDALQRNTCGCATYPNKMNNSHKTIPKHFSASFLYVLVGGIKRASVVRGLPPSRPPCRSSRLRCFSRSGCAFGGSFVSS